MTFSILATDPAAGELGGAVATRRLGVGGRLPVVRAGVGIVASQARSNPWLAEIALDLLAKGLPAEAVLASTLAVDPNPGDRQLHFLALDGRQAAHTGDVAPDWHGHRAAPGVSVAANHVAGPAVVDDMLSAFQRASGDLADRLLAALDAGQAAGGDARGQQSAALKVFHAEPFAWLDLRVDDHEQPLRELRRLLGLFREEVKERQRPLDWYLRL